MTISAKVIADSVNAHGIRLTTMELKYPRFVHAEFMTHRVFSRNASSSRAIPIEKMIQAVRNEPAMPIHWGKNQKGMQAGEEFTGEDREQAIQRWLSARDIAVASAEHLHALGLHKQIVNRVLEPFSHITVVVTATEWGNFLHLRDHPDAQPEIAQLALLVRKELEVSEPTRLHKGDWHLPYVDLNVDYPVVERLLQVGRITRDMPKPTEVYSVLVKLSTARCARVSYLTHDGNTPVIDEDIKLYERLVGGNPLHASPTEHQATPDTWNKGDFEGYGAGWDYPHLHGNLTGWQQHRKFLPGENVTSF